MSQSRDLAELLDRADAGFLVELAQRRLVGILAVVDAALRHLPDVGGVGVLGPVGAAADEDEAVAVEHHHAGAGPVGQGFEGGHCIVCHSGRAHGADGHNRC